MVKVYYTLDKANNILKEVRRKLVRLNDLKEAISLLGMIDVSYDDMADDYLSNVKFSKKFHELHYEFFSLLEELELKGIIVKDLEQRLVDFYSKFEDRDIFLCWKSGEKEIKFWHEIETGFQGRQSVNILKKKNEA